MPIATSQGRENAAAGYIAQAAYMSLHTSEPYNGDNEVTGGAPAYARLPITWTAGVVDGAATATLAQMFDVPTGVTVTYVGIWTAATGGTYLDCCAIPAATFPSQGQLEITGITYTQS